MVIVAILYGTKIIVSPGMIVIIIIYLTINIINIITKFIITNIKFGKECYIMYLLFFDFIFFLNLLIIILWAICIGLVSNLYVLLLIGNFNYYRITINDKKKKKTFPKAMKKLFIL